MKVVSFSLWGDKEMYIKGALENIRLAKELYPEWVCRFYVDNTVYTDTIERIESNGGNVVVVKPPLGGNADYDQPFRGMFWRFLPNDDPDVDVFISRDCDSRISQREVVAVSQWLSSDKCFHTMHDHFHHRSVPILGGMWGAKKGCVDGMKEKILAWGNYTRKGIDQDFLRARIWPLVKNNSMNHSSIHNRWAESIPFPEHERSYVEYVGEAFDEGGKSFIP